MDAPPPPPPPPAETRDWSELPLDALTVVFAKLGAVEVLMGAGLVCHSWLQAAKVRDMWRCVDMVHHETILLKDFLYAMAMVAVDRSDGRLEEFDGDTFVNDKLLQYIGDRSPSLKRLSLVFYCGSGISISRGALTQFTRKCPLLEDLSLTCGNAVFYALYEITGETCPRLKRLELSTQAHDLNLLLRPVCYDDDEPLGIATLHQLQHLVLEGLDIDNDELTAIVDGCPYLELLDVSSCYDLDVDDALVAKCAAIKTVKLPSIIEGYVDEYDDYYCYDRYDGYDQSDDDLAHDYDGFKS
ncbi:putative F-box/LRR-repeat protein 9 [Oryza glaberrima]|uniref:putative F-box/LRR-repeat protein 9 n=1 Tax=Oryza glaberrima TaxID=4538 RepID=UPI00023E3738|nr:putative F-box/LRR-repeat protein 9 [Oryza glaberrima]